MTAGKNKKAFDSNANCPFADIMGYIVTKFEDIRGNPGTIRSKLNKFEHVWGWSCTEGGAEYKEPLVARMTD